MKYTGTSTRAKSRGRVAMYIKHEDFSVLYHDDDSLPDRVIINRKELYDFYYTGITLDIKTCVTYIRH